MEYRAEPSPRLATAPDASHCGHRKHDQSNKAAVFRRPLGHTEGHHHAQKEARGSAITRDASFISVVNVELSIVTVHLPTHLTIPWYCRLADIVREPDIPSIITPWKTLSKRGLPRRALELIRGRELRNEGLFRFVRPLSVRSGINSRINSTLRIGAQPLCRRQVSFYDSGDSRMGFISAVESG